jgi:threonine dehydrogenase-like Zn-dependent dehydrogenase
VLFRSHPQAIVVDLLEERLELVRRLFAIRAEALGVVLRAVNPGATALNALVTLVTGGRMADDVIVAVGSRQAIETAQRCAGLPRPGRWFSSPAPGRS